MLNKINPEWIELAKLLVGSFIIQLILQKIIKTVFNKNFNLDFKNIQLNKFLRYNGIFIFSLSINIFISTLNFSEKWQLFIGNTASTIAIISGIFVLSAFTEFIGDFFFKKAQKTETPLDDILIPLIKKIIKVTIFILGIIFLASNFKVNITSLLTGLGIGGIAIAMAAKNTIENLLGSLSILFDQPFALGDSIAIDGVNGIVESIGLRSTKIRTFYSSQICIPNSFLINAKIDNYGRREYRRIKTSLSITYDTPPDVIESFCEGIRELIRQHPYTRKESYQVYLNEFNTSSLDILVNCFITTLDWNIELRERHKLFLDIIRLANRLEVKFAFPTQSLFITKPEDLDVPEMTTNLEIINQAFRKGKQTATEVVNDSLGNPKQTPLDKIVF